MKYLALLFAALTLPLSADNPLTLFSIDATQRGNNIVSLITTLTTNPLYNVPQSEVVIQTNSMTGTSIVNNVIPYVQTATAATNSTLFIVQYQPPGMVAQYIVVPIEQVEEVVYSTQTIASGAGFASTFAEGVFPLLTIRPDHRAADISNVFTTLTTKAPYVTGAQKVSIQTTLSGSFYPTLSNGLIPYVQSITISPTNGAFLIINYLYSPSFPATIVVAAEQVQSILYSPQ